MLGNRPRAQEKSTQLHSERKVKLPEGSPHRQEHHGNVSQWKWDACRFAELSG